MENSSLVAASDRAHTPVISLNGHRPAAPAEPAVMGIVVIASVSVMALTVTGSADVNPDACVYRKSDSAILVMKTAKNRL